MFLMIFICFCVGIVSAEGYERGGTVQFFSRLFCNLRPHSAVIAVAGAVLLRTDTNLL